MYISSAPFFPCLRKLHIQHLRYDTKSLKHFISPCPVLEHFSNNLYDGIMNNEVILVDIVSSTLKRIELLSGFEQKIHLDVPAIEFLRFRSIILPEIAIQEPLSFLVEADIAFLQIDSYNININQLRESFVRFIQNFANVKVLQLHFGCVVQFFTSVGHAQFHDLTKLEIHSAYFEWRLLACLMDSSIHLEDITLRKTSKLKKHKLAWEEPKNVPICLSTSLRKISRVGYSEDELQMVKYVLRTAEILEWLDIQCSTCYETRTNGSLSCFRRYRSCIEHLKDVKFL